MAIAYGPPIFGGYHFPPVGHSEPPTRPPTPAARWRKATSGIVRAFFQVCGAVGPLRRQAFKNAWYADTKPRPWELDPPLPLPDFGCPV